MSFGKIGLRAAFRITALVVAYSITAFQQLGLPELVGSAQVVWPYAFIFAAIGLIYDVAFKTGRAPWRFASIHDVLVIVRSSTVMVLVLLIAIFAFDRASALPRSTVLLTWVFDIGLLTAALLVRRALHEKAFAPAFAPFLSTNANSGTTLLMLGGLNAADAFMRDLNRNPPSPYQVLGLVSQDPAVDGREVRGVKVWSGRATAVSKLEALAGAEGARAVLFLDDSFAPADFDIDLIRRLRGQGILLLRRAQTIELSDAPAASMLREFNIEELLSRPPVKLGVTEIKQLISGKRVLVTGAGGSIGSEICRQIAALGCSHLGLLDQSEFGLFSIDMEIGHRFPTQSRTDILCDIRDPDRLKGWVAHQKPDIIFHAAALKHVPLMENHPCESLLTNVVGTWNVSEAARINGVGHMVFISTDKAVDPGNVMGATKRLAESVVRVHKAASSVTRYSVVRFGNVLGSAGSVVPTFRAQIARGGPVTVTHADVERYFMTIPEAVELVLHATAASAGRDGGESGVFVLDMGKPVKIMDLARRLIELSDKTPGKDIEIHITGLRPGEKLTEELVDSTEESRPYGVGVFEVIDRVEGVLVDRTAVRRLESIARSGDSEAARRTIFELLSEVRTGSQATVRVLT